MEIQSIIVILLFVAALFYIGRFIYRAAAQKGGGCGSCGSNQCKADFSKINIPSKEH